MLKEEFEKQIGRKAEAGEYEDANGVYMALDYLDQKTICSIWKKADESTKNLIIHLKDMLHELREESIKANSNDKKLEEMDESLKSIKEEYAAYIISSADGGYIEEIRVASKKARELTSMKWVVRYKINNGYRMMRDEKDWVDANLLFAKDN